MRWIAWALLLPACATVVAPLRPKPALAPDLLQRADRLRRAGRIREAERVYQRLLQVDVGSVRAHAGLQAIGLERGLALNVRRSYRAWGDGYLAGILEKDPARRRAAFDAADEPLRSLGLGLHDPTGALLLRARSLDSGQVWIRIALGRFFLARGRLGEAEQEFTAALWTEPESPTAALGRSVICDRRGDFPGALRWARRAFAAARGQDAFARRLYGVGSRSSDRRTRSAAAALLEQGSAQARRYAAILRAPVEQGTEALERFVEALQRGVRARYRHYLLSEEAEGFEEFVRWARDLYERTTGQKLGPMGSPIRYAFVGRMMDATLQSDEPLVRVCAEGGLLLILAQRAGGPPEALLAGIERREGMRAVRVRGTEVRREAVWTTRQFVSGYLEWSGQGDLAGLALDRLIMIDRESIRRWEREIRAARQRLDPYRQEVLAQQALLDEPVTAIGDPAGVAERLRLVAHEDMAREVQMHEEAHLVDAALHLPVGSHLLRNLGLVVSRGFSAERIQAYLERNAQLTALAEGPAPRAALAVCCAALTGAGAHASGYREIVQGIVDEIAARPDRYPEIDPRRVIVQQLHRLSEQEVRAAGQRLMKRWGLEA